MDGAIWRPELANIMLASIVAVGLLGMVGALQAPLIQARRSRAVRMQMDDLDLEGLFSEKPPPSWGSPEWQWGSADGAAHEAAMKVRERFEKKHRRTSMLAWARDGAVDFFDLKLALALSCQRARNLGYDEADGRWESLMEECAACEYEHEGLIDQEKLAAACNKRLPTPVDADNPAAVIAEALDHLGFVQNGL